MHRIFCSNGTSLQYDASRELVWMSFPPRPLGQEFFLPDPDAVVAHFDEVAHGLRTIGHPQAYIVIDYANFDVNPDCNQEYVEGLAKVRPLVAGAVRHSCSILQASLLRGNNVPALTGVPQILPNQDAALRLVGSLCRIGAAAKAG